MMPYNMHHAKKDKYRPLSYRSDRSSDVEAMAVIRRLREVWRDLNRSIFEGKRYENSMRGISFVALLIVVVNFITGSLNLMNGFASAAIASAMFILAGLLILALAYFKKNRTGAVITALVAVIVIFTYEVISVPHGFPVFWTLLLPMGFCYFASVRAGIGLSLYFLALYCMMFCTPLRHTLAGNYSDVIAQRFPILYLADVIITAYIMIQYHLSMIHQMDNARMLIKAKEEADLANAAKSDFLANMSHEIRTPINAVLGMNEMILREDHRAQNHAGDSAPPVREALKNIGVYAEDVKNAGHNLLAIINDILDFSRIEAGRIELQETTYQLSSVLNDLGNMFFFKAQDKGLAFIIDVDESLPDHLRGDEVRLRQVLTNLLNNAVKYTEQGSIRLTVRGQRQEDGRLMLTAAVEDTGIGIRPEDEGKLFTRFGRLDMQRNSTVEGTGLGLVITKRLLDMMGGSISVSSTYGVGSVFTVAIPQGIADDAPIGDYNRHFEVNMRKVKPYREAFRAPDVRVLIVDDTHMNLNVVVNLLKKTEMQIDTASSGADAVALADEKAYDVILMDQRMPGMNGTETLRQIRAEGLNRDTPVICLTADAVVGARERYLSDGFADYLSKPVNTRMLESVILKYLPSEKVQMVKGGEQPTEAVGAADYAPLRAAGIDPGIGLGYCQGDEALYRSLLQDYLQCSEERAEGLVRRYDERDWKAYAILAHTVKSSSKTIGATALSDIAAGLEAAADAGDLTAHQGGHQRLLEKYSVTVAAIRSIIPLPEAEHDDGEIMEFLPE